MSVPLVTVLMPVYNTEKYISEAIDSVLGQTYEDFEFLIIDDGSTDNSVEIINSYSDKRIRLEKNIKNIKLISTLNKGIGLAAGKYICRFDSDDICYPTRIEKQVHFMETNPEFVACSSWIENFYEDLDRSEIIKYEENTDEIRIRTLYQNHFVHPGSFIRKDFLIKTGMLFDKSYIHSEDYHFFVKLSEIGKLYNIQEPLVKVRKHLSNVSVLNADIQNRNSINVIKYQLEKIGINTDDIDFELYFRFFYSSFDLSKGEIIKIERLIKNIIDANAISQYLPHQKLIYFLCDKWFHLCVNSTNYGLWPYTIFKNSELSKYISLTKYKEMKFKIKSIIKFRKT